MSAMLRDVNKPQIFTVPRSLVKVPLSSRSTLIVSDYLPDLGISQSLHGHIRQLFSSVCQAWRWKRLESREQA